MIRDHIVSSTTIAAVVHAADGPRFAAAGEWAADVAPALIGYVRERCGDTLWPADAEQVHALIASREAYAAIAVYFDRVGSRWDDERLDLYVVHSATTRPDSRTRLSSAVISSTSSGRP